MRTIMIGFGSVGRAFVEIVNKNPDLLRSPYGINLQIVAIVDSKGALIDSRGINLQEAISTRLSHGSVAGHSSLGHMGATAMSVIDDVEADVLLELTPTSLPDGEPGLTHIESAIKKGLNVITTNKGPIAAALPSLLELANYQGVHLRFSGTVGGGIPILNFAKKCLTGCKIESIEGILNGTTNYILTRMFDVGITLNEALKEAQRAGYAEADPSYDIDGLDTAGKLVIMSNWIMGRRISIGDVDIEGISRVSVEEVENSKRSNGAIKLVGLINDSEISVHPRPVPVDNPLCVKGTLNAVVFKTDLAGEITVTGRGAGGYETASAVLRDMIDIKSALTQ
jgi:homoserine dehydrogenase